MVERKLEMESRPISALGPAPQQLKEGNSTQKTWDSFHFAIQHFQRIGKNRTALSGKETLGWGSQGSAS